MGQTNGKAGSVNPASNDDQLRWHDLSTQEVLQKLGADPVRGLSEEEVQKRFLQYGPNKLIEKAQTSHWSLFLSQFNNLIVWVLIGAAIVSGVMGVINNTSEEFIDAAAIMAIVMINGILGFLQERKAEAALDALMKMSAPQANVLRGGKEVRIASQELVPGDIVYLEEGDLVPADIRLLEGAGLLAEEARSTGESVPSEKDAENVLAAETPLGDRCNMSYASTIIVHGRARGIVVATGMETEIGHIADLVSATGQKETPLQQRLEKVGQVLVFVCLGICGLVFALGTIEGHPVADHVPDRSIAGGGCHPRGLARHRDHSIGAGRGAHGKAQRHHAQACQRGDPGQHYHNLHR